MDSNKIPFQDFERKIVRVTQTQFLQDYLIRYDIKMNF